MFSRDFRDFTAGEWWAAEPGDGPGAAPAGRFVRDAVSGLLVAESVVVNPVRGGGAGVAAGEVPGGLVVEEAGGVVVLAAAFGDRPRWEPAEPPAAGEVVVVAQSTGGGMVAGVVRRAGAVMSELVVVPPAWLAQIIRSAAGYVPGSRVTLLVPGLGRAVPGVPAPEQYAQQVADLLGAPVAAVAADHLGGEQAEQRAVPLAAARVVFDPLPLVLEPVADGSGVVRRVVSLPPGLADAADLGGPPASVEVEVVVPAYADGSLGLYYGPGGAGGAAVTYPVSAGLLAAVLGPVLGGRPFVIRPVSPAGAGVSWPRVAATVAEVHAQAAVLTGGDPVLAARAAGLRAGGEGAGDARVVVRRLRRPLTDPAAPGELPLPDQIDHELRTARRLQEQVVGPLWQQLADAAQRRECGRGTGAGPLGRRRLPGALTVLRPGWGERWQSIFPIPGRC